MLSHRTVLHELLYGTGVLLYSTPCYYNPAERLRFYFATTKQDAGFICKVFKPARIVCCMVVRKTPEKLVCLGFEISATKACSLYLAFILSQNSREKLDYYHIVI